MKKSLSLFLALVICLIFNMNAFAAAEKSPYQVWTDAISQFIETRSFSVTVDMNAKMSAATGDETAKFVGEIAVNAADSDNPQMKVEFQMFAGDEVNDFAYYYKNYCLYTSYLESKVRVPLTVDRFVGLMNPDGIDFKKIISDETAVTYQSLTAAADGGQEIVFVVDGDKLQGFTVDNVSGVLAVVSTEDTEADVTISDITVYAEVSATGQLESVRSLFTMSEYGEMETVDFDVNVSVNQVGGVTVDFPDFTDYLLIIG